MLKRLFAALVLGGLLLGLTPTAAVAYSDHRRDDHYRCMYHCGERGYNDGYRYDRYRYDRYRYCWYHDSWGWYRARCYDDYHGHYGGGGGSYSRDYGGNDSAHASGGYDSHRQHSGG